MSLESLARLDRELSPASVDTVHTPTPAPSLAFSVQTHAVRSLRPCTVNSTDLRLSLALVLIALPVTVTLPRQVARWLSCPEITG